MPVGDCRRTPVQRTYEYFAAKMSLLIPIFQRKFPPCYTKLFNLAPKPAIKIKEAQQYHERYERPGNEAVISERRSKDGGRSPIHRFLCIKWKSTANAHQR